MKTLRRRIVPKSRNLGIIRFEMKSRTKDDGTTYSQSIDTVTGQVRCDCPGFTYRGKCEHVRRAIECASRHGEPAGGCCKCHGTTGLYEMADVDGEAIKGVWICLGCVRAMEAQRLASGSDEPTWWQPLPALMIGGKKV